MYVKNIRNRTPNNQTEQKDVISITISFITFQSNFTLPNEYPRDLLATNESFTVWFLTVNSYIFNLKM